MRHALLIIGPSRSGSSALTAVLSMRGAALPATLMPPGPGNLQGHFEPQRLVDLNDEVLAAQGISYFDPLTISPAWFASSEAAAFTRRIAETISAEYADTTLPIIKDPRLCRLAPLTIAALSSLGYRPRAIIPLRHPAAAAASLSARDNIPAQTAELLQIRELLGAEFHTRAIPRAWSRYDSLLADWRGTTEAIAETLGLTWPIPSEAAAPAIDAFLAPSLRHQTGDSSSSPLADALYAAAIGGDAAARATFGTHGAVIEETDRLLHPWLSALRSRLATLEVISATGTTQLHGKPAPHAATLHARRFTAVLRTLASRLRGSR